MTFTLRPATTEDADWLFTVRRETMRAYVESAFGIWDDAAQRERFDRSIEIANMQVIMVGRQPAGLLHIERERERAFLANIQILPKFQNKGLGTAVIRSVLAEARQSGRTVTLQVLLVNERARQLYEKLGFLATSRTESHVRMVWRAPR